MSNKENGLAKEQKKAARLMVDGYPAKVLGLQRFEANKLESLDRPDRFSNLEIINRFNSFVTSHVKFFLEGFEEDKLQVDTVRGLTQEYALLSILRRVSLDFNIWLSVFQQRSIKRKSDFAVGLSKLSASRTQSNDNKNSSQSADFDSVIQSIKISHIFPTVDVEHLPEFDPTHIMHFLSEFSPVFAAQEWIETLKIADKLALHATQFAGRFYDLVRTDDAITYFSQKASSRSTPYLAIPLVAVPYTAISIRRDLLTIPHEIGHFIFWRATIKEARGDGSKKEDDILISKVSRADSDPDYDDLWRRWGEEIFADVFGAVLAGMFITKSFEEFLKTQSYRAFMTSDGHHPTPALRPIIYYEAIRHFDPHYIGDDHVDAESKKNPLSKPWKEYLQTRGINNNTLIHVYDDRYLTVSEFEMMLRTEFEAEKKQGIFKVLSKLGLSESHTTWKNLIEKIPEDDAWLKSWDDYLPDADAISTRLQMKPGRNNSNNDTDTIWQKWAEARFDFIVPGAESVNPQEDNNESVSIPTELWLQVLDADDWSTGGPHTPKSDP